MLVDTQQTWVLRSQTSPPHVVGPPEVEPEPLLLEDDETPLELPDEDPVPDDDPPDEEPAPPSVTTNTEPSTSIGSYPVPGISITFPPQPRARGRRVTNSAFVGCMGFLGDVSGRRGRKRITLLVAASYIPAG
jgi:hypothetical protein